MNNIANPDILKVRNGVQEVLGIENSIFVGIFGSTVEEILVVKDNRLLVFKVEALPVIGIVENLKGMSGVVSIQNEADLKEEDQPFYKNGSVVLEKVKENFKMFEVLGNGTLVAPAFVRRKEVLNLFFFLFKEGIILLAGTVENIDM